MLSRGEGPRRWEVEARLLAAQDDASIAAAVGISIAAVAAYGTICFDVRSRLGAADWVMAIIKTPWIHISDGAMDIEAVWKSCGYHLGPLILDSLVADYHSDPSGDAVDPKGLLVLVMTLPNDECGGPQSLWLAAWADARAGLPHEKRARS